MTSSSETCWLIAAIRRKERIGPGMLMVVAVDWAGSAPAWDGSELRPGAPFISHASDRIIVSKADRRARDFIVGPPMIPRRLKPWKFPAGRSSLRRLASRRQSTIKAAHPCGARIRPHFSQVEGIVCRFESELPG